MESADKFFPDRTKLEEVYGNQRETFDLAASKFHNSERLANYSGKDQVNLSYAEARQYMYT